MIKLGIYCSERIVRNFAKISKRSIITYLELRNVPDEGLTIEGIMETFAVCERTAHRVVAELKANDMASKQNGRYIPIG